MSERPGRPSGEIQVRDKLLRTARKLFSKQGYTKVTIRLIAEEAGVDSAMIRYYFENKQGLFKAVMVETIQPLLSMVGLHIRHQKNINPGIFIETYYKLMAQAPDLPTLIFRSIQDPESPEHPIINSIFKEMVLAKALQLKDYLGHDSAIQPGFKPENALITILSLAIFPFLMPGLLKEQLGIQLTPEFLQQLAEHQKKLLVQGLLLTGHNDEQE